LLRSQGEKSMTRFVDANDLELFAVNTGQFYARHKQMAAENLNLSSWQFYVRQTVLPRYCREIEPVTASAETIATVAANLKAYYGRHLAETAALAAADSKSKKFKVVVYATKEGSLHMNNAERREYIVSADSVEGARLAAIEAAYQEGGLEHVNPRTVTAMPD
jgi:hypothetical protein